jgi:hypothetical protein
MKQNSEFYFLLSCLMLLIGCSSGKEVFVEDENQIKAVNRIAIVGFPGQCTHEGHDISNLKIAIVRFDSLNRFQIVSTESTYEKYSALGLSPIYVNDEYSTLDVQGIADLCVELDVDAVVVGFYRTRTQKETTTTPIKVTDNVEVTSTSTYAQNFPTFEVCIIGIDGSLLFRGVSEGRKTGFWNAFWDSLFKSESDDAYYDRIQDAMDGICEMLKD